MNLKQFIYQIRKMAGDADGETLSADMMLEAMSDEMSYCAAVFPHRIHVTGTIVDHELDLTAEMIQPDRVISGAYEAEMYRTASMDRIVAYGTTGHAYSMRNGVLRYWPDAVEVTVYGRFKPPRYSYADFEKDLVSIWSYDSDSSATEVAVVSPLPLSLVRYRMLQRACEEISQLDKAQYYMAIAARREQDVRHAFEPDTTDGIGLKEAWDF